MGGEDEEFDIGIRVYLSGGVHEVTSGSPVAVAHVSAGVSGHQTVTATWDCVGHDLAGDSVYVEAWGKITSGIWTYLEAWETEVLPDSQLDVVTWTVSYHVRRTKFVDDYNYSFAYGEANSFINNFSTSTPGGVVPVSMGFSGDTLETSPFKAFRSPFERMMEVI